MTNNLNSKRPYDGQSHTDAGERGKTLVEGLTMRDVADCFARALFQSSGEGPFYDASAVGDGCRLSNQDMHRIDLNTISPGAWQNSLTCEIEKMMGIFPNLPGSKPPARQKGTVGALVVCQNDSCASEISYPLDQVSMFEGAPICQQCYEDGDYGARDDKDNLLVHWGDLPAVSLEDLRA